MLAASKLKVLSRERLVKTQADPNESPFPWQRLPWINFQSFSCCDQHFFRNSASLDSFAIVDHFLCVSYFHFDSYWWRNLTNDVLTNQWKLQCVDINKLYNISCYDRTENISHCTIYITAFHAHFVRRECRHSAEWQQCAERCATEIKVGHLNYTAIVFPIFFTRGTILVASCMLP